MIGQPLAWLHIEKQMVKVIEVNYSDKYITYYDCSNCKTTSDCVDLVFNHPPNSDCVFERCDILWPTGFADKNDDEIYTGFIVRHPLGVLAEIKYMPEHAAFVAEYEVDGKITHDYLDRGTLKLCEIAGNKFENPELLKEGETVEQRD